MDAPMPTVIVAVVFAPVAMYWNEVDPAAHAVPLQTSACPVAGVPAIKLMSACAPVVAPVPPFVIGLTPEMCEKSWKPEMKLMVTTFGAVKPTTCPTACSRARGGVSVTPPGVVADRYTSAPMLRAENSE